MEKGLLLYFRFATAPYLSGDGPDGNNNDDTSNSARFDRVTNGK